MSTVKIALVGPKGVGKTCLANALAGDFTNYGSMPTVGVRIREFRVPLISEDSSASVELWDLSGDLKYESCWPAVTKGLNGLAMLYDPKNQTQSEEVGLWMETFCKNCDLSTGQVVVMALNLPSDRSPPPIKFKGKSGSLEIPIIGVSLPKEKLQDFSFYGDISWDSFVDTCYKKHPDNQELEDEDDAFLDGK